MLVLGVILFFRNGDALVKIEVNADDVEVTFVNKTIKIADGEQKYTVTPGEHHLHIKTGNAEFDTELFMLKKGNNPAIKIEIVNSEVIAKAGDKELEVHPSIEADPVEESGTRTIASTPTAPAPDEVAKSPGEVEVLKNGSCEEPIVNGEIPGWKILSGKW